ncbi:MAG TPA: BON domain-containing protein [Kofleriaceae bacterium]|nr:BON domain-containing protein [Kofleriaceae bacterium]
MKTDSQLKQDVTNELKWEPSVNETHIGVSVKNGIVTLSGHVPTYGEKYGAEKAAKRVAGVKAVADELDVKLASSATRTDEDIAAACLAALKAHSSVPDEKIKLVVNSGWITLEGLVDWQYQKTAAESAIRYLNGVLGITNSIKLVPRATIADVKDKIEAAFKRSARIDAAGIVVEVHDGKVTLRGKVHSLTEKTDAQYAAWSAPGVFVVENDLVVTA